jgi:DNA polymerase elongation subunit (family B)
MYKKYTSYGLKNIIKQEGLEKKDRQFYDSSQIRFNYKNKEEWNKIKQYCLDDAADSLALYDLFIPTYFYLNRIIPKPLQALVNGATGSQVNAILIRSYLQIGHSIPDRSESAEYQGAISFGNPGSYKYCQKVDVASLYPSIIITYGIYNKQKDPKANFLNMVKYLTEERLKYKKLGKETGNSLYKELDQSIKLIVNSSYGFLGTPGLLFNSPSDAQLITSYGRDILNKGIKWVEDNNARVVNVDTDSFMYTKDRPLSSEEIKNDIVQINSLFPKTISWEDDGYYSKVVVVKAKNYILYKDNEYKIKGSALKIPNKEPAIKEFVVSLIELLGKDYTDQNIVDLYHKYVLEVLNVKDMSRWTYKKSITSKVIDPQRTNERKVLDALEDTEFSVGDKVYMYFDKDNNLKLLKDWKNDHNVDKLLEKLFKTTTTFETIINKDNFLNYKLKRNKEALKNLQFGQVSANIQL